MNVMFLLLLCLQHFAVKSQPITINRTLVTTAQENCFSNFECPLNKFCYVLNQNDPVYRCFLRSTAGKNCNFDSVYSADPDDNEQTCVSGLTCAYDDKDSEARCVPQLRRGDVCRDSAYGQCPKDDLCTQTKDGKYRCTAPTYGILGSRCPYSTHCLESKGVYCKNKVCVQKKSTGASCQNGYQCLSDICSTSSRCIALQREWQMCLSSTHCENSGNAFRDGNHVYCNVDPNSRELGRCIRDSKLLKTLGAPCSRNFDRCDRRRGLTCGWVRSERRFRCQQMTIGGYCTPNSNYSRCENSIWPRDCFLARDTGEWWKDKPRFYACNPKKIPVPIGTACNRAPVDPECPKGASCEYVGRVLQDYNDRYGPPSLRACVYLRGLGQNCGNRFRTQCKPGLMCKGGKCVNGTEPCCKPETHADFGLSCQTLPCIPGAECVNGWCRKPEKVMKLGQPCYESVLYTATCEKPLRCLGNFRGKGESLCRKPRSVGGVCESDEDCASNLKCTPSEWYDTQICYDGQNILKVGEPCNPKAKWNEKRCVGNKLSCLPKGSRHVCQYVATLFQYCSPKNNTICLDSRLKCDTSTSACLSK